MAVVTVLYAIKGIPKASQIDSDLIKCRPKGKIPTMVVVGVSVVRRTNSQEFDANWLRAAVNDGLAGLEGDIDMARTDG